MKIYQYCLGFFLGISALSNAQSGVLDPTFGTNGLVTTSFGSGNKYVHAIAIQPDGKIVVAGEAYINAVQAEDFAVARYNTNGTIDASFGAGGLVLTDMAQNSDAIKAIAIQPDGKIIVAGHAHNGSNYDFAVARYLANGTLDNTFGANGKVLKNFGSTDFGLAMALLPNGKILVAGRAYNGATSDFALLQLNSNGTFDNGFGMNGTVSSDLFGTNESANALAIQSNGKIVVAGDTYANNVSAFAVARFNPDGTPDLSFSGDGRLSAAIGTLSDVAYGVSIQPDGKIVLAGQSNTVAISDFALARFLADGTPDLTFSGDGQLTTNVSPGGDYAYSVALQPDGKILAGGFVAGSNSISDFAVVRYLSDGSLDASFGNSGVALADFMMGNDVCNALVWHQNKIVAAGFSTNNGTAAFAVARFLSNNSVGAQEPSSIDPGSAMIFPNPVQDEIVVEYTLLTQDAISFQLFDLQGNMIQKYSQATLQQAGQQCLTLEFPAQLPSGAYILRLLSSSGSMSRTLIKK